MGLERPGTEGAYGLVLSFQHGDENPAGIESPLLGHMGSFSYTFPEAGTYVYHCDPHPYMTGSVTVTP